MNADDQVCTPPPGANSRGRFTPVSLLIFALEQRKLYEALSLEFPAGTVHTGRNDARRLESVALRCAEWLEAAGLAEARFVGPFGAETFQTGERVILRKGSRVFGSGPQIPREGLVLTRAQRVSLHRYDPGYCAEYPQGESFDFRQAQVHWAGAGGYWRWTDANNVDRKDPGVTAPRSAQAN